MSYATLPEIDALGRISPISFARTPSSTSNNMQEAFMPIESNNLRNHIAQLEQTLAEARDEIPKDYEVLNERGEVELPESIKMLVEANAKNHKRLKALEPVIKKIDLASAEMRKLIQV